MFSKFDKDKDQALSPQESHIHGFFLNSFENSDP